MKKVKKLLTISLLITFCMFLLTACGNKKDYTIVFNSNGGSSVSSVGANNNDVVNKPNNPTKEEYDFVGWFYDSELTQTVNWPIEVYRNITLYAKWTPNTLKLVMNGNTLSWKFFENGVYTIEIDNDVIEQNYTLNHFEISTNYNDGNYHTINITYKNFCQTYFYRHIAGTQTSAPTNFVVENSLLKWNWVNENDQFDFTGFKIFVDGKYYTTQFAPQLVMKRFVDVTKEKIYKIAVYATSANAYDSNITLTNYNHALEEYQITLVFNDNINQNTILTTNDGKISLPTPSRENYAFNGWYTSNNGGQALINKCDNSTMFFSNTILYAEWIQEIHVAGKIVLQSPAVSINDDYIVSWSSVENTSEYLIEVYEVCEDGNYKVYSTTSNSRYREFDAELYYLLYQDVIISIQAYGDGVTTVSSSPVCREINYYTYYKSVIGDVNYDPNIGVFYWNTADDNFDIEISKNAKSFQNETATNPEILIGKTTPSGELTIDVNNKKFTATNYRLANPTNIMILLEESDYYIGFDSDLNYDTVVYSYEQDGRTYTDRLDIYGDYFRISQSYNRTNYKFKLVNSSSNYFETDYIDLNFENTIQVEKNIRNFYFTNDNKILFFGYNYEYGFSGSGMDLDGVFKDITGNFSLEYGDFIKEINVATYAESDEYSSPLFYVFALSNNGQMFSWGYNANNFLLSNKQNVKTSIPFNITNKFNLEDGEIITNVNVKKSYITKNDDFIEVESVYVQTNFGKIYTWGYNNGFMFMNNAIEYTSTPTLISNKLTLPQDDKIVCLDFVSNSYGCAISEHGRFFKWNKNITNTISSVYSLSISGDDKIVFFELIDDPYCFAISNNGKIFKWNINTTNTINSIYSLSISGVAFCSKYYVIDFDNNLYLPQKNEYSTDYYHWTSYNLNLDNDEYIISVNDEEIITNKNVYSINDF